MSGNADLDRLLLARLGERLEARATTREPEGLLAATQARIATTRQRPRWFVSERWSPMTTLALRMRPPVRFAWLAVLLAILIAILVALALGSPRRGLPSNGRILFGQGGDVFELKADGSTADLTAGGGSESSVAFSPDGATAIFFTATDAGSRLATLRGSASAPSVLSTTGPFHPTFNGAEVISWSPDSSRITFGATPSGNANARGASQIVVVDVATGMTTTLPLGPLLAADTPSFSHDGRRIAFRGQVDTTSTGHSLYVMDADGTNVRRLTGSLSDGYDAVFTGVPVWAPDDRSIVIDAVNNATSRSLFRLFRVDVSTGVTTQLTDQPRNAYAASYSPDGTRIAFTDWQDPRSSLWVMYADGSGQTRLAEQTVSVSDQWSPDGQWILFEGQPNTGHDNSLYKIHPDGSGLTTLLEVPTASEPRSGVTWQRQP